VNPDRNSQSVRTPRVPIALLEKAKRLNENPDEARVDKQYLTAGDPNALCFNIVDGKVISKLGGYHDEIGGREGIPGRAWFLDDGRTMVSFWKPTLNIYKQDFQALEKELVANKRDISKSFYQHAGHFDQWIPYKDMVYKHVVTMESIRITKYCTCHIVENETCIEEHNFVPGDVLTGKLNGDILTLPDDRWIKISKENYVRD